MTIRITLAGATGWAGSALAQGIANAPDLELVSAISRSHAGEMLGSAKIYATAAEALAVEPDVFVEYTKPDVAKSNILAALRMGANVVVGTSGLSDADYAEIAIAAEKAERAVLAVGNFAITAVLAQKFAEIAARYIPHWELIDYASTGKKDAPSGTVRELANRLAKIGEAKLDVPLDEVLGVQETRGARMNGTQVHAVRLPGYIISFDAIFGMPDQKLIIRHEAGNSAEPYVAGALLAIRNVSGLKGLHRGLDSVMQF